MKLYFLRHATATETASTDALRPLTQEGRREARWAGLALARLGVEPEAILTSPLLRARQTADLAARALGIPGKVHVLDQLKNGAGTAGLRRALKPYELLDQVVLVGHLPSLPLHIAAWTGMRRADALRLGKGAVACVGLDSLDTTSATLRWLMSKKQLRLLGRI